MSPSIRITVTVPKEILNVESVRNSIEQTMRSSTGPDLKREFEKTTEGWVTKPGFSQEFKFSANLLSTRVYPSGAGADTYALVNAGSPPHLITQRRLPLQFKTGYVRSTSPRVLSSRANRKFGPTYITSLVKHPGFEAREFDDTIAKEYGPVFEKDIQDAIDRASK